MQEIQADAVEAGRSPAVQRASERLFAAIDERADELTALLRQLVQRPSVLGYEADAQRYVAQYLADAGLDVDVWDLDPDILALENAGDSGVPFHERPNVAGIRAGQGQGRSLILNGHIDVVSPEPVDAWSHDPWAGEIVGDRMYGRGAHDMKSGVAINLFLARLLHDLDIPLAGDLTIESVIEEECTGNGALAACERYTADAALVTEATEGRFIYAQLGVMWFRVKVFGRAAHAGMAYEGVNAIEKLVPVIQALQQLNRELNADPRHPLWVDAKSPIYLNMGVVRGGDWPSTLPGEVELHCRVSFYPGVTVGEMRERIERAVAQVGATDDWLREHPPIVTYDGFQTAGAVTDVNEPSVRLLAAWYERLAGAPLLGQVMNAVTDQRYFTFKGIPCGCYGATGGNSHAVDEWVDIPSLAHAAKVIGGFVLDWCGVAE